MPPRSSNPAVLIGVRIPRELRDEIDAIAARESMAGKKLRRSDVARAAIEAGLRVLASEGVSITRTEAPRRARAKGGAKARREDPGGSDATRTA